jgi:GNAT superfamily N-acetyltransferase
MIIEVHNRCADFNSYRAARVKSLFNAEDGAHFDLVADIPDDPDWSIGVIVGPSGSGKSSLGHHLWGGEAFFDPDAWPADKPIVDCILPEGDFNSVTAALAQVGLGDVPAWLRPYQVLSTGQKFRANLARVLCEAPQHVVIDEFTSVVDRQIAKIGAGAFAKAWRRTGAQAVLLTCHYDVLDWLEPDWVFDTARAELARGSLQYRRPKIEVDIREGSWELWPYFKPHHYLDAGPMPYGHCYVGFVEGEPVVHVGVSSQPHARGKGLPAAVEARACRLVTLPEWQGAGIGMKFLNTVCQLQADGLGIRPGRRMHTLFHTSHPQLCAALRRDRRWIQVSAELYGTNKGKSIKTMSKSVNGSATGYGGHFRAVQGFRYIGEAK